jgi:ribosomal protein S1
MEKESAAMPIRLFTRHLLRRKSFEGYQRALERQTPVTGRVVETSGAGVLIDLPPGLVGFVRRRDLPRGARRHLTNLVGTQLEGLVVSVDREAPATRRILVSPRALGGSRCLAATGTRRRVVARVIGTNRGGLILEVSGLQGFLPRSEMPPHTLADLERMVETERRCYVLKASMQQAILSDFPRRMRERRALPPRGQLHPAERRRPHAGERAG